MLAKLSMELHKAGMKSPVKYNMGMETNYHNKRNTTMTYESPITNGGVHPVDSGYWQIADVYWFFLKNMEA